jgi:hypothetical protein
MLLADSIITLFTILLALRFAQNDVAALDISLTADQYERIREAGRYLGLGSPHIYTD